MKTDPTEFDKFVSLLPKNANLHFIPVRYDKSPDVPRGESIKDDKYRLTTKEARSRIKAGKNVAMYLRNNFVVMDVDDPEKAQNYLDGDITKKTLTVSSRSGKPHIYFLRGDDIEGRDIPDIIELRTGWRYVLVPGSRAYDRGEYEKSGMRKWGLYTVVNPNQPTVLRLDDLSRELRPKDLEDVDIEISEHVGETEFVNKHGWKLGDIRQRDKKLDYLLTDLNPKKYDYPSRSEADLGAMTKLLYWEFDDNTISQILREFRRYEKTNRKDYLVRTLKKAKSGIKKTISDFEDPVCWNPVEGRLYHERGKFVPKFLAENIMADFHFITLEDTEEIYVYGGGVFLPKGETTIREEAQKRLGKYSRKHYQNEVVNFIKSATYTPRDQLNKNPCKIVVENGILNVQTLELEPHAPNPPFTVKIPVEYDPSAECPKIKNFLGEVLKKKDIPVIQEYVGYSLLKDHRFHKAIMLTGGGANGKSTFLNLVRKLLGRENVSSPSLHDLLYNRFAKADLYGKLANIHADLPSYTLKKTGTFKMLTGEDQIYAEKKHKDAFHFDNFAKLMFSANKIPETKDITRAFFFRWLIIEFPYKFTDDPEDGNKNKDPRILEKITTPEELSGFLNWALKGLKRLLENNEFSSELTVGERADIWIEMSDPIVAFKEAKLVVRPDVYSTKEGIYNAYVKFCHEKNTPPLDKNIFSRELPKRITVEKYRPRINGKRTQCWKGITLKHDSKPVKDTQSVLPHETGEGKGDITSKHGSVKGIPDHPKEGGALYCEDIALEHDSKLVKDVKDKPLFMEDNSTKKDTEQECSIVYDIESIPDIPDQPGAKKHVEEIVRLLKRYGGKTPVEIADKLDMQLKNVEKILEALFNAGVVEREQEKLGGGKIYNIVRKVDSCPSVFDIKKRLWGAFGVRPFKQSELFKHFSENELERVNKVISQMKENGEIRLVPMESGIAVWELTPKEQGG